MKQRRQRALLQRLQMVPRLAAAVGTVFGIRRGNGLSDEAVSWRRIVGSETSTIEVKLAVGAVGETVEVNGGANLAQTESSTLGRAVDQRTIQALPLANPNYTQILALSPGVVVELPRASALAGGTQIACDGSNVDPSALGLLNFQICKWAVCHPKPAAIAA
jgi:hypothetical protein